MGHREVGDTSTDRAVQRWGWRRSTVTVGSVLACVGGLNMWLHRRANQAAAAEAAARRLRALLHEESNLQWRVLAERGSALHVAREMGELRRGEYAVRDEVAARLPGEVVEDLVAAIDRYHDAIDHELGMLAVGRSADARAYEQQETVPLFEAADELLVRYAEAAAAQGVRARVQATSTLVVALASVLVVVGVLFRRSQQAHETAARAVAERLRQEREVNASLERARAMVHHQATHDALTGLPNRLGLREHVRTLADAPDRLVSVVFVDLDNFKAVNDRYGHDEGDRVLQTVARALRGAVRAGEVAARVGGDEFNVVAGVDSEAAGDALAARIRERVRATCRAEGRGTGLDASVGTAVGPARDIAALLRQADRAMYAVKRAERSGGRA